MEQERIFISAGHGLALIYFLQSEVVPTLLESGTEVILLTDDRIQEQMTARFGKPNLIIEGLRLDKAREYTKTASELQWWLTFLRRVGSSNEINTQAMDSYIHQTAVEEPNRRRLLMPLAWIAIFLMRRSRLARNAVRRLQDRWTPEIYADLFDRYAPGLVVTSTPGWRYDRYLLREAAQRGIETASVIVGWDNPSSYGLPGAKVDWITCWSDIQTEELVHGTDWAPERVHVGGIPAYDGYFRKDWQISRDEYFRMHGLDPARKLLSYACSFISFSPNYQNVEALSNLVSSDGLAEPSQLLIRLHPNHFLDNHLFAAERERIRELARSNPRVFVVDPVPLGGDMGHYSGEDMPEKASMMAHSDVFLTVYSTMVVEAAIHGCPIVSVCLDVPGGWNWPRKYSLPLTRIGSWPTHARFRDSGAGRVVESESALRDVVNAYLNDPNIDKENREAFIAREVTFTDGRAGERTADFLLRLLSNNSSPEVRQGAFRNQAL